MLYHKRWQGYDENETVGAELLSCLVSSDDDSINTFLRSTRRIVLTGEVNEFTAFYVNSQLQEFATSEEPVYMYISSPGGSLTDGYSIIDQIQLSPFPTYTIVRGQAHSMAAIITAYGTKGHRFITSRSNMMLHPISLDLSINTIHHQQKALQYAKGDYKTLINDLAGRIHLTPEKLTRLMDETIWVNAEEAIKLGIVDKIWTSKMEHAVNESIEKKENDT